MRLSYVNNQSGLSLAELVVALGLTSLLLVLVVSGALFVKKYVADWSDRDKITEELAFMVDEFQPRLESAQHIGAFGDSIIIEQSDGTIVRYSWPEGALTKDSRSLTRAGLTVNLVQLRTNLLPEDSLTDTLKTTGHTGQYSLTIAVSDHRGNADTLTVFGRNMYEALKYQP